MPVTIKQLTLNTKVSKKEGASSEIPEEKSSSATNVDKEEIINECMKRVKELLDYELRP